MKNCFLFSIVAILSLKSFSQSRDLLTLESLKKQVPNLKDTALVNCLNLIAYNFTIIGFGPGSADFIRRSDSIFRYANLAFEEAKKINYERGMVDALNQQASSENIKSFGLRLAQQNDSAIKVKQQKYLSAAIALAENINYDDGLGISYMGWPDMGLPKQSKDDTIDHMKKSLPYFQKAGDKKKEGEACTWIAEGYFYKGYYENAIEYCQRGLVLNHETVDDARTKEEQEWRYYLYQQSLSDMADLYKAGGDYASSLEYFEIATQFGIERHTAWTMENEKGEIFRLMGQNDSSFYYLRKTGNMANSWTKREIAATYIMAKKYDSALAILKQIEPRFRKDNITGNLLPVLFLTGSAYAGKNEYNHALPYAREGISDAEYLGRRADIMIGYELLSRIHHHLGNNDSAYYYLDRYIILKDSIQNRQFLFRINNYKRAAEDAKKESRIGFLNRDNQIKQQQLKQQATFRNFLIAVFIAMVFAGLYVFRNINLKRKNEELKQEQKEQEWKVKDLENENKHIELQKQSADLEMQALRAQMNPHFIFNSLSSINHFILKNESKTASSYLTRFSRLIRMVLINSQRSLVTLQDELQMLELYLEMERLRFKDSFDYSVTFLNTIDSDNIFIPPLLLQPFCENAIWHGLMHKEGQGKLHVELSMENNVLNCTITDNGIGREKAEEMKSKSAEKEKSMGLRITQGRLNLLNQEKEIHTSYNIEDLKDAHGSASGTRVNLKISYQKAMEVVNV